MTAICPAYDDPVTRTAVLSPCGAYRYSLSRVWNPEAPWMALIMLNPSTADAEVDDPTITRCMRRARGLGRNLEVANLFALRSTDPRRLERVADPIGPENDAALCLAIHRADTIVAAWGARGGLHGRDVHVGGLVGARKLWCLGTTRDGHPRHPLYVAHAQVLVPFELRAVTMVRAITDATREAETR